MSPPPKRQRRNYHRETHWPVQLRVRVSQDMADELERIAADREVGVAEVHREALKAGLNVLNPKASVPTDESTHPSILAERRRQKVA